MAEGKQMYPVSGEVVETDGVYSTEWGREELLKRGDIFPSDVMMGDTEWKLESLPIDDEELRVEDESKRLDQKHLHIPRISK
ncbi:MAG: hypothetical protein K0R67_1387 [Paenibacillus sp.]|nr:hypothetical protein [Paenibacillus sp.]